MTLHHSRVVATAILGSLLLTPGVAAAQEAGSYAPSGVTGHPPTNGQAGVAGGSARGGQQLTPEQQAMRDRAQSERLACRSRLEGRLAGEPLKEAVLECVASVDPQAARRMRCRERVQGQQLAGQPAMAAFRSCMSQG